MLASLLALTLLGGTGPEGSWRAVLDLAGGSLRFSISVERGGTGLSGRLCNASSCERFTDVELRGDSLVLDLGDYAAGIVARLSGDSLTGTYQNVGRRGPRIIPFRAARGRWPAETGPARLLGRWDAWYQGAVEATPRVFEFRNGGDGLEGTVISNSGDYGLFWGRAMRDSFELAHFDGANVYLLAGRQSGDTLRGVFHAGLRTQTPFVATRSTGRPHLTPPTAVTRVDTTVPLAFTFPDLEGHLVSFPGPAYAGKVVLVDIFGTWCPACHDAAPVLGQFFRQYHARGLEILGLAFEVTGDPAQDGEMVRRFREKFAIPYTLLLGGASETDIVRELLPALDGFTAFPTTLFVGRDGKVRRVHAGFYGPATGAQHPALVADFRREIEALLAE
jgi:thiol-disulfide isomerase/thioredoxin